MEPTLYALHTKENNMALHMGTWSARVYPFVYCSEASEGFLQCANPHRGHHCAQI